MHGHRHSGSTEYQDDFIGEMTRSKANMADVGIISLLPSAASRGTPRPGRRKGAPISHFLDVSRSAFLFPLALGTGSADSSGLGGARALCEGPCKTCPVSPSPSPADDVGLGGPHRRRTLRIYVLSRPPWCEILIFPASSHYGVTTFLPTGSTSTIFMWFHQRGTYLSVRPAGNHQAGPSVEMQIAILTVGTRAGCYTKPGR
jgi:hypothetical protein